MGKSNYIFKGLGYAYIITLAVLLVYNLFLTFVHSMYFFDCVFSTRKVCI